jgi:PIN domain nuclease of toxin-antitoxin system
MRLLVDAQPLLWHRAGDPRLPEKVRHALADQDNELFISEATWWEICVKLSLKKLELLGGVDSLREEWIGRGVAESLPVEWHHTRCLVDLPFVHRDPFDRMLVVQALTEKLTIVGGDSCFARYSGVKVLW